MLFKYWIEFDESGEILNLFKSKSDCADKNCKEYIVKLIEINRSDECIGKFEKESSKFLESVEEFTKGIKSVNTELEKTLDKVRKIK